MSASDFSHPSIRMCRSVLEKKILYASSVLFVPCISDASLLGSVWYQFAALLHVHDARTIVLRLTKWTMDALSFGASSHDPCYIVHAS